jgi:uncharacterized protein YccT (UPF0319 family)
MPVTFGVQNTYGLSAPAVGYVTEATRKRTVELATVQDENGVTVKAKAKKLITEDVSAKGKGDAELADVTAGSFSAGVVKVTSAKQSETSDEFPDWEQSGQAFDTLA